MNILFWNLKMLPLREEIFDLAHEHGADLVLLAEETVGADQRLLDLNRHEAKYFFIPSNCERIRIFSTLSEDFVRPRKESAYYSLLEIKPPLHESFLLLALHYKSKMWRHDFSQSAAYIELGRVVREAEKERDHRRTVIVGDFNADPFDHGISAATGFHGVMSRNVATRMDREVSPHGKFPFFYNPSWSMFGDENSGPPGSYYQTSAEEFCQFWHIFDQCLIRPELVPFLPEKSFSVLTSAGEKPLVSDNGTPNLSDHLPILFKFGLPLRV